MACNLTQAFSWDCKDDTNGVKAIYLVEYNSSDTITKASGEITVLTLASSRVFFKWELEKETAEFTAKVIPNEENNSVAYEAELKARLFGITTAKRNELKLLAKTRILMVVKDNGGEYWLCGMDTGCRLQETTGAWGKKFDDYRGFELTIKHRETDLPVKIQSSVVSGIASLA